VLFVVEAVIVSSRQVNDFETSGEEKSRGLVRK